MTENATSADDPYTSGSGGGFFGSTILARAARGSTWTALSFVISQAARFGGNLILTRLLFPEAFGIMALITMMIVGIVMLSDMGINQSVVQSKRGDEPIFLDTAWTLQIARGVTLWLIVCAIAHPAAVFYDQPIIAQALPVAGFALVFAGLEPMRVDTENRHLRLGRVTALDLLATLLGLVAVIVLAWLTRSIWALVASWVITNGARMVFMWLFLPGRGNRIRFERAAAGEVLNYGGWIFLASICGFLATQGDRAILGKTLTIDGLGIYNIGLFLGTIAVVLGSAVTSRILVPLYRELLGSADEETRARLFRQRYYVTGSLLVAQFVLAMIGVWVVGFLYDDRYVAAGAIMVAVAVAQMISVVSLTYDQAALATGDSRGFFFAMLAKAGLQMSFFFIGAQYLGIAGALLGLVAATGIYHPLVARLAARHGAWDARHDLLFLPVGAGLAALAVWLNWSDLLTLIPGATSGLHAK